MLSVSNYIPVLPSNDIENNQNIIQTFPEDASMKMIDDEVFCNINDAKVTSSSEVNDGTDCIMLRQRTNFPRKREASCSISEEPKRRDHDRSRRVKEQVPIVPMDLEVSEVPKVTQPETTNEVVGDFNGNECQNACLEVDLNFNIKDNEKTIDNRKCHVEVMSIPCLMPSFVTLPKDKCTSMGAKNASLEDCSVSSSTSDLSISSAGTSAGIQEDLDCLHLTDVSSGSSNAPAASSNSSDCSSYASPLVPSLFHSVPPTIYFSLESEKVHPLPSEVRVSLKWKLSTITPVLIKQLVERSGFQLVKDDCCDWIGTWGKHMKCVAFKKVKDFQKVNHFPGCFHLGRKDKMTQIYNKMVSRHDPEDFDFYPETFVLPQDIRRLREVWKTDGSRRRWIIKPPASARGTGIKVIHKWSQIPKKRPVIVQRYLSEPYLINDAKFDLRVYVLVSSYDPLRVYIYEDGLVRFASAKYSSSAQTLNEPFMHLTNYSINRKNAAYTANNGDNNCHGHKWSLKSFWNYMNNNGVDSKAIWGQIVDLVLKTIICSEGPMTRLVRNYTKSRYNSFELFGFDIMLDKNLKPWLLEVNISPSLHTSSSLDFKVKGPLAKDMLNIAGFQLPEKVLQNISLETIKSKYSLTDEQTENLCMNKSLHYWYLSPTEKEKHSHFTWKDSPSDEGILDSLTPDDIRQLIESEDEFQRCGAYTRIFPSVTSSKYLQYFEYIRYYNLLLDAWEQKYHSNRDEGISLLQSHCQKNLHLQTVFKSAFQV